MADGWGPKMNACRNPERPAPEPRTFEFCCHRPENTLRVQCSDKGVLIRAARNNFSPRQRSFFIRHLAEEGFIPDQYRMISDECGGVARGVEWVVDDGAGRMVLDESQVARRTMAFMIGLFGFAGFVWLILLAVLFSMSH
jgi:hypothetical protein